MNLLEIINKQRDWSQRTFGDGKRTEGLCKHIEKELAEIRSDPEDVEEWVDVMILAMDGAWRCGATPEKIVAALAEKQAKNMKRQWNVNGDTEPCEHVREETKVVVCDHAIKCDRRFWCYHAAEHKEGAICTCGDRVECTIGAKCVEVKHA